MWLLTGFQWQVTVLGGLLWDLSLAIEGVAATQRSTLDTGSREALRRGASDQSLVTTFNVSMGYSVASRRTGDLDF